MPHILAQPRALLVASTASAGLLLSGLGLAQKGSTPKPQPKPAASSASQAPSSASGPPQGAVRKDPKGVQGVSPFREALHQGDSSFIARDYPSALNAYKTAIVQAPHNPLGHYRVGQAHAAQGQLPEASEAYAAALRYAADDQALKAKLLFVLADLAERQKQGDKATTGWAAYEAFAQAQPAVKAFPATAVERKKQLEAQKQRLAQYAKVKERIAKQLAKANKKAQRGRR